MPPNHDRRRKKTSPQTRDASKEKSVRRPEKRPQNNRGKGKGHSLRSARQGLDPREAIDQWLLFAKEEGYSLVTGKRRFDSDLDRIDTILQEEESLFRFCRSKDLELSESLVTLMEGPPTREGHEHRVFYHLQDDPPRVTKVTFPHKYGRFEYTPFLYLERLALSNVLFPVLKVRFENFVKAGNGQYSIISSMSAFSGPHPQLKEVDQFLTERGFAQLSGTSTIDYVHRSVKIYLRDCHSLNWVKSKEGVLIPIDVIPEYIL